MGRDSINTEKIKDLVINILLVASLLLAGFFILKTDRSDTAQTPLKSDYKVASVDQIKAPVLPAYNEAILIDVSDVETGSSIQAAAKNTGVDGLPPLKAHPDAIKSGSTGQNGSTTTSKYLFDLLNLRSLKLL